MAGKLTEKQARFVTEYLVDLNAKQAAIRAGYSPKNAESIAVQLLKKTHVSDALQQALKAREARTQITADRVLREFARIAFFDARKLYDDNGDPKAISELDDDTAAAIAQLDITETPDGPGVVIRTRRYRVSDKIKALEALGKHLALFNGQDSESEALARLDAILRATQDAAQR